MPSKPAPFKRSTVYTEKDLTVKLRRLLDQPTVCAKVAAAWGAVDEVGRALLLDLPDYCRNRGTSADATVTAMSLLLSTFEVFKDQYELDKKSATPHGQNT